MSDLPGSVLFCCTQNALRSPMAEAILKHLHGRQIYVDSAGVRAGPLDEFAVARLGKLRRSTSDHEECADAPPSNGGQELGSSDAIADPDGAMPDVHGDAASLRPPDTS